METTTNTGIVHPPTDRTYPSELPEHWVFASQLARQTLAVMLTTRSGQRGSWRS